MISHGTSQLAAVIKHSCVRQIYIYIYMLQVCTCVCVCTCVHACPHKRTCTNTHALSCFWVITNVCGLKQLWVVWELLCTSHCLCQLFHKHVTCEWQAHNYLDNRTVICYLIIRVTCSRYIVVVLVCALDIFAFYNICFSVYVGELPRSLLISHKFTNTHTPCTHKCTHARTHTHTG